MPKEGTFNLFVCDRNNSHSEYIKEDNKVRTAKWHSVKRFSRTNEEVTYLLCEECYQEYIKLAEKQDSEFASFLESAGV